MASNIGARLAQAGLERGHARGKDFLLSRIQQEPSRQPSYSRVSSRIIGILPLQAQVPAEKNSITWCHYCQGQGKPTWEGVGFLRSRKRQLYGNLHALTQFWGEVLALASPQELEGSKLQPGQQGMVHVDGQVGQLKYNIARFEGLAGKGTVRGQTDQKPRTPRETLPAQVLGDSAGLP